MTEKRTPQEWAQYLMGPGSDTRQYTLEEYTAACLGLLLGHTIPIREAVEGNEGVTRRIDEFLMLTSPRLGVPYPRGVKDEKELLAARQPKADLALMEMSE